MSALMFASIFGNTDTVKVLLKHGATVDKTNVRIFDTSAIMCVYSWLQCIKYHRLGNFGLLVQEIFAI